ncbi:protein-ADP-ribose hydrolase [Salinicoccus sp. ID82-1]|uniref:protein-ADP-ribose hydrolase n=1 Tax=Salinicoccus sp. ID82-1 TaxID=2820269 RepID=UPI001F220746|nr:protein-ADP-ribose hydrolase [Salinicoccus sp. ID82-1]MCG1010879.1 protein-ADP-ribose hydrolase [Salinicoccus sp. ID82-1]
MANIELSEYANAIRLYEPFEPVMAENTSKETLTDEVLEILRNEKAGTQDIDIPDDQIAKRRLIRALLNIRQPLPLKKEMMRKLDALLQQEKAEKQTTSAASIPSIVSAFPENGIQGADMMALWQGNITDIKADAIVNAANEKLLGCMQPLHDCVDNAIHSAAGPMLRDDCAEIIHRQKSDEEIGTAKITRGYHLPSTYVIHTVGPAVTNETPLNDVHVAELISSYQSCLDLAHEIEDIRTIAFPAISTGVFGFPKQRAAEIAVTTVGNWLKQNDHHFDRIVFNVYSEADKAIYEDVFK